MSSNTKNNHTEGKTNMDKPFRIVPKPLALVTYKDVTAAESQSAFTTTRTITEDGYQFTYICEDGKNKLTDIKEAKEAKATHMYTHVHVKGATVTAPPKKLVDWKGDSEFFPLIPIVHPVM